MTTIFLNNIFDNAHMLPWQKNMLGKCHGKNRNEEYEHKIMNKNARHIHVEKLPWYPFKQKLPWSFN